MDLTLLIAVLLVIVMGIFQLIFELSVKLLAMSVEFLFRALIQGKSAASEKFRQRQVELGATDKPAAGATRDADSESTTSDRVRERLAELDAASAANDRSAANEPTFTELSGALVFLIAIFAGCFLLWRIRDNNRQQQITQTRTQVARLAEKFVGQVKHEDPAQHPQSGLLEDRDVWDQPLELSVEESLLGTTLLVRSSGPDQQPGTIDDIHSHRSIGATATEVGGELANRGFQAAREKIKDLLPEKQDGEQPDETDAQQDQTDAEQTKGRLEALGKRIKQLLPGKKADEPADSPELEEN